jgi:hypothetical protein
MTDGSAHRATNETARSASASVIVRDAFFGEDNVLLTTELCVRSLNGCKADPLTVFGNVAIRSAVTCTLTTDGLSPFSTDLRIVIPFHGMTAPQLHAVRAIATNMHDLNVTRYNHPNDSFSASCPRDSRKVLVEAAVLLFAINVLILRAVSSHSINTNTVINVTQQRILACVSVHRSHIARADELTRAYVTAKDRHAECVEMR